METFIQELPTYASVLLIALTNLLTLLLTKGLPWFKAILGRQSNREKEQKAREKALTSENRKLTQENKTLSRENGELTGTIDTITRYLLDNEHRQPQD